MVIKIKIKKEKTLNLKKSEVWLLHEMFAILVALFCENNILFLFYLVVAGKLGTVTKG